MPSLADLQATMRHAVVDGTLDAAAPFLAGGADPARRLAIHHRHYETSLTSALLDKFPACAWLIGAEVMTAAATAYVRAHPPAQPCIADYGRDFPQFLGDRFAGSALGYLESFGRLEWAIGKAAIAVDPRPVFVTSDWAIDELIAVYLNDSAPDRFVLRREPVVLEVSGARGAFTVVRQ